MMNRNKTAKKTGPVRLALVVFLLCHTQISAGDNHLEEMHIFGHEQSLALPSKELDQVELDKAQSGNMTKLLEKMPGISNASFGEGVGRPVIRGMSANRVKLSINGATNADVSSMSSDHAPVMDIVNAENVEVIYGPNILRFGGGAMGGLVNVNDHRFHDTIFNGLDAKLQGSLGSNARASQLAGSIDIGKANSAGTQANITHIDFFARQADNFSAGERNGSSEEIDSSSTEALGGSLAYNIVDNQKGSVGIALGYTDYNYGIPNNENIDTKVTPEQWRVDLQGHLLNLSPLFEKWENTFTYVDYQHEELLDDQPEALFEKQVSELQSTLFLHTQSDWIMNTGFQWQLENFELCHNHSGCTGIPNYSSLPWDGQQGDNLINDTFDGYRFSHSTPMPLSETQDLGLFFIAGKTIGHLTTEFGLRYDTRTISTDPTSILPSYRRAITDYDDVDFEPISFSLGLNWDFTTYRVALNLSHSERAPTADEMFYNGDHHATFSYQLDNIDLDIESANSADLSLQFNFNQLLLNASVFYYDFEDYIYNDLKSVLDPYHGRPVYRYEQADAKFTGSEISLELPISNHLSFFSGMDIVKARLNEGDNRNLPRTPPMSLRSGLTWNKGRWSIETDFHYFDEQDDVSENESVSEAYTTLNALTTYEMELDGYALTFQLKADNLLNEFGVNHTSYLKDYSPIQGRNIEAGFILRY